MMQDSGCEPEPESNDQGTIQFAYDLQPPAVPVLPESLTRPLGAWRRILRQLELLGQLPGRYDNVSFGNLSVRDPDNTQEFIITASQTGALPYLDREDLVRIKSCRIERFWVEAEGAQPPSSDTLIHALLYAADARIRWVFHVHSPDICHNASRLNLPYTETALTDGTNALAAEVAALLHEQHSRPLAFATPGHKDGIFCCGSAARDTGTLLVDLLAKAYMLEAEAASR